MVDDMNNGTEETKEEEACNPMKAQMEEVDKIIDTILPVVEEMIDKHGEKFGKVVGKLISTYLVGAVEETNKSRFSEATARTQAKYTRDLYQTLMETGFSEREAWELTLKLASR
jgi:hypothetical protein